MLRAREVGEGNDRETEREGRRLSDRRLHCAIGGKMYLQNRYSVKIGDKLNFPQRKIVVRV